METVAQQTHNDLPAFVPEQELRTALTAAQSVTRQRDDLAAEVKRLRRELEASARAQRELDGALAGGDNVSRRLKLLRDALARKDAEIITLKTNTVGHARLLKEAQETAERLRRERGELEQRLRTRDGAFSAIERERAVLSQALDGARRDGERAAEVVVQADHAVHEWRQALDACTRELEAARQQITELRAAWQAAGLERQRLAEAHAAELGRVRAEAAAVQARLRSELEGAVAVAAARFDVAREAHAITLRAAEDAHGEELAEAAAARAALEGSLAEARARIAQLEQARAQADGELAAARSRLQAAEACAESIAQDLKDSFGREIEALRRAHDAERQSLAAVFEAEMKALREPGCEGRAQDVRAATERYTEADATARRLAAEKVELEARLAAREAELARAVTERDESQAGVVEVLADKDARHAAALRELRARLEELEAAHREATVEAQRCFAAALEAQRESLEADLAMARDASAGGDARVADLERDLDAAREALGQYAADAMARLQQSERAADEAEAARERYARKYAAAARELECARGELEGARRTQATAQVAVEAMTRAVEQLAAMAATRAGRRAPELTDVEEALSLASDGLPEEFAELLWSLREPLLERCRIVAES